MLLASLSGLLALIAQLHQSELWSAAAYGGIVLLGVAMSGGSWWCRARGRPAGPRWGHLLAATAVAALVFGVTGWRAADRMADALPPTLEGADLTVTGRVAGLPRRGEHGVRFVFEVRSAERDGVAVTVPRRVSLSWFERSAEPWPAATPDAARPPDGLPSAGERWQFTVRLRRPHGHANPHGHDHELWLFERGIRATGHVRLSTHTRNDAQRLDPAPPWSLHAWRERVRDAIFQRVQPDRVAGVLAALVVGEQAAIQRADWATFRATGTAHLVVISGLHVALFAWLVATVFAGIWRRHPRAVGLCATPSAARWAGLSAGLAYALFSGWGLPAQRTVWMLATWTAIRALGLQWRPVRILVLVAAVVLAVDPWALLQPGFWLSFTAVGLLFVAGSQGAQVGDPPGAPAAARTHWRWRLQAAWQTAMRAVRHGARAQFVTGVGLAPLTLVFFQQTSVVGFVANAFAIPVVTLAITPLSLLGLAFAPLWSLAAPLVALMMQALEGLAAWRGAVWYGAAAPAWAVAGAMLAVALLVLRLPLGLRLLALPLALPMLWPAADRPAYRHFDLLAVDVGQGTAALVRTAGHTLLYDTGPAFGPSSDAGERVLVPLLQALGERPDLLVLSHGDLDHVGGAGTVLTRWPHTDVLSALAPGHHVFDWPAASHRTCAAGQSWTWDGVRFEVLHPPPGLSLAGMHPNTMSCVLAVRGANGGALLPGDIERAQELALVAKRPDALAADLLLASHHGSRTSSHALFIDAVAPSLVVFQAGHLNPFSHPAHEVVARFRERGVKTADSPSCGALWWRGPQAWTCHRREHRRYWHWMPAPADS